MREHHEFKLVEWEADAATGDFVGSYPDWVREKVCRRNALESARIRKENLEKVGKHTGREGSDETEDGTDGQARRIYP